MAATSQGTVHVLGVRHHGPGSARSVLAALDELNPDGLVIEGPPELDSIAPLAASQQMCPPVAALVYDIAEPRRASFYPLASFSPEWVALRWALSRGTTIRFADLPAANALAPERDSAPVEPAGNAQGELTRSDPIAVLAHVAGYSDPERWWEDTIEHRSDRLTTRFAHLTTAMAQVREADPELNDPRNQQREAAMRKVIRDVMATHHTVAVVCGAFHAPALAPHAFPSRTADNRLLAGLPRTKVGATWSPWTNDRLSRSSGYGAGITAPGWYHHLFEADGATGTDIMAAWLVRTARALRAQNLSASTASVVETVRMAHCLAVVRGRPSAGLPELDDAALTVLCEGNQDRLNLVRRELFVGDAVGQVPPQTPMVPLAADLQRTQKSLRLKPTETETVVNLDLRQESQLARSVLFHRLNLLNIHWASVADTGATTGTFKESWLLHWQPELAVAVIEASRYGNTLETACAARVAESAADADLPTLSALVHTCLLADLEHGLQTVVARLGVQTAHSHDIRELLRTVEPLARTVRYGDVRGLDTVALLDLVRVVVRRVSVGLRTGCQSLDDDSAELTREALESAHRGITLLEDPSLADPWLAALAGLDGEDVHGDVAGRVVRILLDAGILSPEDTAHRMSRRLSVAAPAPQTAAWLDAFLAGDALLLLHDAKLLGIVDEWVSHIRDDAFEDLLPLLRRTFSGFGVPERRLLADRLLHAKPQQRGPQTAEPDLGRALPAIRAAAKLLGLEVTA